MAAKTELTEKEKSFIEHYTANGGNGADAVRKAGYATKYAAVVARGLLNDPIVRAEVLERQQAAARERIADIDEIKRYWTSVMRGQETETCRSKNGEVYTRIVRTNTRLKAAEALARSHGAFLRENVGKGKEDFNFIWVDDYGEDEDYPSKEG